MSDNNFDYVSEIWKIADYVRDIIKRSEYNRIILPFSLLRRLECALEETREDVLEAYEKHEEEKAKRKEGEELVSDDDDYYCAFSKRSFYNTTNFRLNTLGSTDTLEALMCYVDGFSPNARDILKRFKMEETCKTLDEHGMLYSVCTKFAAFDLSPDTVSDREMSNIYEHLIQKFGDEIAEDAEDFMTPKDVVRLAVGMIFAGDDELMNSDKGIIRSLYDPTIGSGGFICDALDQLDEWHKDKKMVAPAVIVPYGQECEQESWAIAKSNLLLRNVGGKDVDVFDAMKDMSAHIMYGDTLTQDAFPDSTFNYILSNPPYGKKWEKQQSYVLDEAKLGFRGRFGAGLPSIDDGSMLFLQHVVSKLAPVSEGGGKAGVVLSGSPLFTGDAGSGPSSIRRWLFENDYIDCIVKLPTEIFFRTGITTYLWILTNNKEENRKGKIQLIDASERKTLLKRTQGNKRSEISEDDRNWIIKTYIDGHDHGKSVLVPYQAFMYRKITTQQPLHMEIQLATDKMNDFLSLAVIEKLTDDNRKLIIDAITKDIDTRQDYYYASRTAKIVLKEMSGKKPTVSAIEKAILTAFGLKGKEYKIVLDKNNNPVPDPELKDFEQIDFHIPSEETTNKEPTIEELIKSYMDKEVLPYAPETWVDNTVTDKGPLQDGLVGVVGTGISFNNYFYQFKQPRSPKEIADEILELENGLEEFMKGFLL